jgi:hypothetical protein
MVLEGRCQNTLQICRVELLILIALNILVLTNK